MKITAKQGYTIVEVSSRLTRHNLERTKDELTMALQPGQPVVLDMSRCSRLYSLEISLIIRLYKDVQALKGQLCMVHASSDVEKILENAKLHKMIPLYKSIEAFELDRDLFEQTPISRQKFQIDVHPEGKWTRVVFMGGMVGLSTALPKLNGQEAQEKRAPLYLLDFSGLVWVDSYGLEKLIEFGRDVNKHKGAIAVVKANEIVKDLIRVFEINDLFRVFDDMQDAKRFLEGKALGKE